MGNGTQSPTAISGGDGYDQLTINAHYPYWSVISGFEEISADGTGVIPDHIGQAGTTLKFSYVNDANLDFSAETDANIEINTNTRTREAAEDTNDDTLIGGALDDIINSLKNKLPIDVNADMTEKLSLIQAKVLILTAQP